MSSKSLTILRHCVASGPTGLSPLQQSLIDSDKPVRIYAAPTGAGKSYAFQRLIQTDKSKRVLFVVPTRRLAQNIAQALLEALATEGVDKPKDVVAIWSSDEKERLKQERPSLNVGRLRLDQVNAFQGAERCQFIISTPETVALMLVKGRFPAKGETPFQIVSLLKNFDHIVFDEFHLIEARGFGLAASMALMTAKSGGGTAKVTFLSATPINIKRTLITLGVDENCIDEREELIVSGDRAETGSARALHGDVEIVFEDAETLPDLIANHIDEVRPAASSGRQVVSVFDSNMELQAHASRLARLLDSVGIRPSDRMVINSFDDRVTNGGNYLFLRGSSVDPMKPSVILSTSSIEIGVTLRASLMIMDPGYDAASFVQRIGRVARGDAPGKVIVRTHAKLLEKNPWLRQIVGSFDDGARLTIGNFTGIVLKSIATGFDGAIDLDATKTFSSMPQRAIWSSALFWIALSKSPILHLGQRQTLKDFKPKHVGVLQHYLIEIERASPKYGPEWTQKFIDEAVNLRDIAPSIFVIDPTGARGPVPIHIVASRSELRDAPQRINSQGELEIFIDDRLNTAIERADYERPFLEVEASFPTSPTVVTIAQKDVVDEWLKNVKRRLDRSFSPSDHRALTAAAEIVKRTRIVPFVYMETPSSAKSDVVL